MTVINERKQNYVNVTNVLRPWLGWPRVPEPWENIEWNDQIMMITLVQPPIMIMMMPMTWRTVERLASDGDRKRFTVCQFIVDQLTFWVWFSAWLIALVKNFRRIQLSSSRRTILRHCWSRTATSKRKTGCRRKQPAYAHPSKAFFASCWPFLRSSNCFILLHF